MTTSDHPLTTKEGEKSIPKKDASIEKKKNTIEKEKNVDDGSNLKTEMEVVEEAVEDEGDSLLRDLTILPPLQIDNDNQSSNNSNNSQSSKNKKCMMQDAVFLPPLHHTESVASIRQALSEIRGYAHITRYRLEIVEDVVEERQNWLEWRRLKEIKNGEGIDGGHVSGGQAIRERDDNTGGDNETDRKNGNSQVGNKKGNSKGSKGNNNNKSNMKKKGMSGNDGGAEMSSSHINNSILSDYNPITALPPKEGKNVGTSSSSSSSFTIASPYTGRGAIISSHYQGEIANAETLLSVSSSKLDKLKEVNDDDEQKHDDKKAFILNDYCDLSVVMAESKKSFTPTTDVGLQLVLEKYDTGAVREHVARLRHIFDGNIPTSGGIMSMIEEEEEAKEEGKGEGDESTTPSDREVPKVNSDTEEGDLNNGSINNSVDTNNSKKNGDKQPQESKTKKEEEKGPASLATKLPVFPLDHPTAIDGCNLADHYYLACGEEDALEQFRAASLSNKENRNRSYGKKKIANGSDDNGGGKGNNKGNKNSKQSNTKNGKGKKKQNSNNNSSKKNTNNNDTNTSSPQKNNNNSKKKIDKIQEDHTDNNRNKETDQHHCHIEDITELNILEEKCRVKCSLSLTNGYNPPLPRRRMMGDIMYIRAIMPDGEVVHLTAVPTGFYVNRTSSSSQIGETFDPTPCDNPCFSHTILDCLLQKSTALCSSWIDALWATFNISSSRVDNAQLSSLFRSATRTDGGGPLPPGIPVDSVTIRPSWIVPLPRGNYNIGESEDENAWTSKTRANVPYHSMNEGKAEYEITEASWCCASDPQISNGILGGGGLGAGPPRDWNEEFQSARELPISNEGERIERARVIHRTLADFGDAAVTGSRAVLNGLLPPMNPHEPPRSHVYLHDGVFFSRAVDAAFEAFRVGKGDAFARKSASREASCVGAIHVVDDLSGPRTLATVIVDHMGTRLICQSVVPGILSGGVGGVDSEALHKILYGAVEMGVPLSWESETHKMVEDCLGGPIFQVASRKVPVSPLGQGNTSTTVLNLPRSLNEEKCEEKEDSSQGVDIVEQSKETVEFCGPIEMKCIRGSDGRTYCLDVTRLTPRDANWVPKECGGTGNWEDVLSSPPASSAISSSEGKKTKGLKNVPVSLADDEWVASVLRPELITSFTNRKMQEFSAKATKIQKSEKGTQDSQNVQAAGNKLIEYQKLLQMNLNVFLPGMALDQLSEEVRKSFIKDQDLVSEVSSYLWLEVLPRITKDMIENSNHQPPVDGKSLTEYLHKKGVNCRYLGRLASLASEEEDRDLKEEMKAATNESHKLPRRVMPVYWLELLECEMVARAAKHVLDKYLIEKGGSTASNPAQTVAAFLSALMSVKEESVADTENRVRKQSKDEDHVDNEDVMALTIFDSGKDSNSTFSIFRGREEIWAEIEKEVGRRFRYILTLYNHKDGKESSSRTLFIPLLRRFCQKTGIRLAAKNYNVGSKCVCSCGTQATATYPISPVDILDIVPMVKHAASEGFVPCISGAASVTASLHILLPDAKIAFESAQMHLHAKALPRALDFAQEALSLYQMVVETPLHVNVSKCLDLTAVILFQAQAMELAASNAAKALAVAVQIGGFDCAEAIPSHSTLCHILLNSGDIVGGIKHLRASMYLMELLAGPRYIELSNLYYKLGNIYHEFGSIINALRFYQDASSRKNPDRVVEGMLAKATASILATLSQYKLAFESEKRACNIFRDTLGEDCEVTKTSSNTLKQLMKMAVEQSAKIVEEEKKRKEDETAIVVVKKKKKKKKPKKKK